MHKLGKYRLCLQEKPLADSHIIPEFLYKPLYDEMHRLHVLSSKSGITPNDIQKGYRERLLCTGQESCEEQFSRWERYASQVLFHTPIKGEGYDDALVIRGINYEQFKLFQMSLLFRAGVAKHPAFADAKLGPHEEHLRRMLIDKDPGQPYKYGCMILVPARMEEWHEQLIVSPASRRFQGYRTIAFILNGLLWLYFVSSHNEKIPIQNSFLMKDGILPLLLIKPEVYKTMLGRILRSFAGGNNLKR